MSKKSLSHPYHPNVLAFSRSIAPGSLLMYSAPNMATEEADLTPIIVRDEPMIGLNATAKTKPEECGNAVLNVVESALMDGLDPVLVLLGSLYIGDAFKRPHSCDVPEFVRLHKALVNDPEVPELLAELSRRYAVQLASGAWAWRNADEASALTVTITPEGSNSALVFKDLFLDPEAPFDLDSPAYAGNRAALLQLAQLFEDAFSGKGRGLWLNIRGDYKMGRGKRVYPSQEWESETSAEAAKKVWKGSKEGKGGGRSRVYAKLANNQAFINERKMGNMLRRIDTWYDGLVDGAPEQEPIAVESYGANSRLQIVKRGSDKSGSIFGTVKALADGVTLSRNRRLYYLACCIRGGLFGVKETEA